MLDTADKAVWEYVSNSLRYVDPSVSPAVRVVFGGRKKQISIIDNARGMDWSCLENLFGLSGEGETRSRQSESGNARSAAFGIGDTLRITTIHNSKRTKVELTRRDIEAMNVRDQLPLRVLEREVPAPQPNGTVVEIDDVRGRSLNQEAVIRRIEQYLSRWPQPLRKAIVFVNSHLCLPLMEEEKKNLHNDLESLSLSEVHGLIYRSKDRRSEQLELASTYGEGKSAELLASSTEGVLSEKVPHTEATRANAGFVLISQLYKYWTVVQGSCYKELLRRDESFPPLDPEFGEELQAHAAYLKRLAGAVAYAPDELFNADHHRANFRAGLTAVFTRHLGDEGLSSHLSVSYRDAAPSEETILLILRAFFDDTSGMRSWQGAVARHFEKAEAATH